MKNFKKITLPTYLTLLRLFGAPILVPFFIVNYVPQNNFVINLLIASLFLMFGFTDYLDGFFARKYQQQTQLGATLDHLADKFLTFSAYLALVAIGKMEYFWAILLIGREFFVMGLREIALENDMRVQVSSWGKLKTVTHIALIAWMIIKPVPLNYSSLWYGIELILLVASVLLSYFSAINYFIVFYAHLKK
ncbi:CDP-diacylglycerol--glycerol-3-phosphate 3-phosphatidyltransferase [Candidatus Babeliales bacterium]|nr:CDP-diacylglycerol--glycerol-3-phosphate 3-phosphatidyltransferase [Candidatus Babeliales bacterium]MBP9843546.1 CDP-diacylglycerol--glycerol-3-phosphate 3-phosphatidyltransferase [Candidatus Babeliales bacterium]